MKLIKITNIIKIPGIKIIVKNKNIAYIDQFVFIFVGSSLRKNHDEIIHYNLFADFNIFRKDNGSGKSVYP